MKIYLDINQFGEPHWLGPLAQFDPKTIREYHRQRWIDAQKAKLAAAQAARKVRVLGDANPNRWPAGSPDSKGGEFAPKNMGAKSDWIREKIDAVADKMKFPKDRIHMSMGTYMFELNGNQYRAGGIAINSPNGFTQPDTGEKFGKGDIVIYGHEVTGFEEDMSVRPLVAHEIQHQMYNQVMRSNNEEFAHLYTHNPDLVETGTGRVKPEALESIKGSYPTLYALESLGWGSDTYFNALEEEDGVTWYSKQYWDQAGSHKPGTRELAINETLAEIASLIESEDARIWDKDTGNQMTEHLRGWLKSEYEKEGGAFADPEEHASQMQDPWAYVEMMEDTDGDDEFRKKFGTKVRNIKGFRNGEPIYYRPIFTDYPDPVISPTWMKLFNTLQQQYKRLNNITDAGFDPAQPRNKRGEWTSTQAALDLYKGAYINPMNDREFVWAWQDDKKDQIMAMVEMGKSLDPQTMHLQHIRAYPQRKGAGRLAMKKLQAYATERGLGISLDVARNSDTPFKVLRKFYSSLGFKDVGNDQMVWRPNS